LKKSKFFDFSTTSFAGLVVLWVRQALFVKIFEKFENFNPSLLIASVGHVLHALPNKKHSAIKMGISCLTFSEDGILEFVLILSFLVNANFHNII
jgi:hypothetical protein